MTVSPQSAVDVLKSRLFSLEAWVEDTSAFVVDAVAGTIGGVFGVLAGSPFDVVKTRVQAGTFKSATECVRATLRTEGFRAFFRGALVSSLGQAPNNAVIFGCAGWTQRTCDLISPPDPEVGVSFTNVYIAGSWAGFVQSIALAPFENIKVQQQLLGAGKAGKAEHPSMTVVVKRLIAEAGFFRGIMRGWVATMLRDAPTFGLYFLSFEAVKAEYVRRVRDDARAAAAADIAAGAVTVTAVPRPQDVVVPVWAILAGGGLAGVASWSLALPADVIKSNIQGSPLSTPREQLRFTAVARRLIASDGIAGLFRGAAPCILRAIPVNAITFLVYHSCLEIITGALPGPGSAKDAEQLR